MDRMATLYFILYFCNVFDQFQNSMKIKFLINLVIDLFVLLIYLFVFVRNSIILWYFLILYFHQCFLLILIQEFIEMIFNYQYCEIYKFDLIVMLFFCLKYIINCQVK